MSGLNIKLADLQISDFHAPECCFFVMTYWKNFQLLGALSPDPYCGPRPPASFSSFFTFSQSHVWRILFITTTMASFEVATCQTVDRVWSTFVCRAMLQFQKFVVLATQSTIFEQNIRLESALNAKNVTVSLPRISFIRTWNSSRKRGFSRKWKSKNFSAEKQIDKHSLFFKQSVGVAESMEITPWTNASLPAKSRVDGIIIRGHLHISSNIRDGSIRPVLICQKSLLNQWTSTLHSKLNRS